MLFRDLERRLEDVAERLDRQPAQPAADHSGIMEAIDARFTAFAQRLETNRTDPAANRRCAASKPASRISPAGWTPRRRRSSSIDPGLIRSLEAQVSELSAHLSRPGAPLPEFEDIRPRLDEIERFVAGNHQALVEAARQAAENAVRSFVGSNTEAVAVEGLAEDLKALEALTRRSDERNGKTFEAIHDTLLKIVDRLGSLETSGPVAAEAPPASVAELLTAPIADPEPVRAVLETPSLDPDEPAPLPEADATFGRRSADHAASDDRHSRSPAQAAAEAAAAVAALGGAHTDKKEPKPARSSMFGGIARAFARKGKEQPAKPEIAEPVMEAAAAPSLDLDAPLDAPLDPKIANRPLEPGSGAPDLNAIMRRVRDERGQQPRVNETDAAKSDFIAAARRAAQAAAAEADALKRNSDFKGPVRALRIGDLVKARRKSMLMAVGAVMLALAGLQLGKAFLSDPVQSASVTPQPVRSRPAKVAAVAPKALDSAASPGAQRRQARGSPRRLPPKPQAAADATVAARRTVALDNRITNSIPAAPVVTQAITAGHCRERRNRSMPEAIGPAPCARQPPPATPRRCSRSARAMPRAAASADIEGRCPVVRKGSRTRLRAGAVPHRQFLRKGHGVARDVGQGQDLVPAGRRTGQCQRHAQSGRALRHGRRRHGRQRRGRALVQQWPPNSASRTASSISASSPPRASACSRTSRNPTNGSHWSPRQGDKDAAAKRDEIAKALRPEQLEARRGDDRAVEGQGRSIRRPTRSSFRTPGRMRRHDRQHRHEEGRPEHPGDPQQERLRRRQRRRRAWARRPRTPS